MSTRTAYALTILLMGLVGCTPPPQSGKGFTLPPGDTARGEATFVAMQCNACHALAGVEQLAADGETPELSIKLGGEVSRIQTYGELVTSIINPSHRLARGYPVDAVATDGQSKMPNYNDVLTVSQLADLVTYLQSKYTLKPYEPTNYPMYGL